MQPVYRIRIGGKLLERLQLAMRIYIFSASEIFGMAINKARRVRPAVVVDKKTKSDHKCEASDYGEVLKVYDFDPAPENNPDLFRAWLGWYLGLYDLSGTKAPEAALQTTEEQYKQECELQTLAASAAIQQGLEPFEALVEKWRGWKDLNS